ncbi:MAG: helix-turn-helix transcriptional regulator [Oscillospiraceae bacterium]|nr:helix-turn-helix transcriptional regulator [Oscillospiraceae bacterium]
MSNMYARFRRCGHPFFSNCCYVDGKSESNMHSHDFPHLWYCLEGRYTHIIDSVSYKIGAGSLVILPPGTSHEWEFAEDESARLVQVNLMFNIFDDVEDEEQLRGIMHMFLSSFSKKLSFSPVRLVEFEGKEKAFCDEVFSKISSFDWRGEKLENFEELKKEFFGIFSLPCFNVPEKAMENAGEFIKNKFIPLLRTVYYMNLNYNKNIETRELLKLSNMCQTDYFRNIKLLLGGCTWSKYLQYLKVRHAVTLSTFSRYPLQLISDYCGFGDISYMTRQVKRLTGHLPGEMKKSRDVHISHYPDMDLKDIELFEKPIKHFYFLGIK